MIGFFGTFLEGALESNHYTQRVHSMNTRKYGSEIKVGDMVYVGTGTKTGRVLKFLEHPELAVRNPGFTGRVAVTDRGSITLIDQQQVQVPV